MYPKSTIAWRISVNYNFACREGGVSQGFLIVKLINNQKDIRSLAEVGECVKWEKVGIRWEVGAVSRRNLSDVVIVLKS